MESSQKKIISAYTILLFGIILAAKILVSPVYTKPRIAEPILQPEKSEIICWYTGKENRAFFEMCADDFGKETGIVVTLQEQSAPNYFSALYEATRDDNRAPDVYLLEADNLEQAYLAQLLEKNVYSEAYQTGFAQNAIDAAAREGDLYGYPLYFHTMVFAYRNDYFESAPKTVQEMIDYSVEHEPGEGVEKLLEWNLSDGFCNFPFFGTAVEWQKEQTGTVSWEHHPTQYEACKTFFGNLTAAIELDENTVHNDLVLRDFINGKTLAVFVDSDEISKMQDSRFSVTTLPGLNEEIPMLSAAKTMLLCVNEISEEKEAAADFAAYVTLQKTDKLSEMTGHMPVKTDAHTEENQKTAYLQYEASVIEPDALNATDFWVKFQNEVLEIWNDAE